MTIEEFRDSLKFEEKLERAKPAFLLAVKDVVGAQVYRIFEEGKNSSGGSIGNYNTENQLYVGDSKSPQSGNHKGKPKDGKAKTITTTYYQSYQSFRQQQGRESGFVNLRLFGRLMSDLANAPVSDKVPNEINPTQLGEFEYATIIRDENVGKKNGAEAKYGKIFDHTQEEVDRFFRTLNFELSRINA